jgi:hypothetical protein
MSEEPQPRRRRRFAPPSEPTVQYEVVKEEPWRFPWRWVWIGLTIALLGAGGYYLEQRAAAYREVDVLQDLAHQLGKRYAEADQDYATRMAAHQASAPFTQFVAEEAINPGVRSATRAWVAAAVAIIDEALAKREQIPQELNKRIDTSKAGPMAKESMAKNVREAVLKAQRPPHLVQAYRAYLEKIAEMAAFLDQHAQEISLQDGRLEFDDATTGERYNAFEHELARLDREYQRQKAQAERIGG